MGCKLPESSTGAHRVVAHSTWSTNRILCVCMWIRKFLAAHSGQKTLSTTNLCYQFIFVDNEDKIEELKMIQFVYTIMEKHVKQPEILRKCYFLLINILCSLQGMREVLGRVQFTCLRHYYVRISDFHWVRPNSSTLHPIAYLAQIIPI